MGKWDYAGVHGLNKYIWKLLQDELGWTIADYGQMVPITTPQQQPEFNSFDKPYIVYGYTLQSLGTLYALQGEVATYTVFSTQSSDIRQAVNLIASKLGKFDESARDVNKFIAANGSADNKTFDYKSIRVTQATGPEPAVTEGGRQDGSIIVSMEYTQYDANGLSIRF
jgi:hypothetical protein